MIRFRGDLEDKRSHEENVNLLTVKKRRCLPPKPIPFSRLSALSGKTGKVVFASLKSDILVQEVKKKDRDRPAKEEQEEEEGEEEEEEDEKEELEEQEDGCGGDGALRGC
ncbi:unnamed protein product [Merluccius merluccius]